MKAVLQKIVMLGVLAFTFTSCYNAIEKTLLDGNYEDALESALPKLKNERKKDEYIHLVLKAYNKAMEADKYAIERLKATNENANWGKIYYIYKEMEYRQSIIEPYLPITYKDGSEVEIETFNYIRVIEEARKYAAAYHYNLAKELLTLNKEAARDAYYELNKIDQYYKSYFDKETLKYEAKQKGTNHILIEFKSAYGVNLPQNFLQYLSEYNYDYNLRDWTQLHRTRTDSSEFDLVVQITIDGVEISPEHVKETRFHEQKQVSDGYTDLLDSEGNVVVDSLGNAIQIEKFKTLHCDITEWTQTKSARIFSSFEIYDTRYNQIVVKQPIEDQVHFANNYARAYGHTDILDNHYHEMLRGRPLPFPTNSDMIFQTAESLKKQISKSINRNDDVLASL